MTDNTDLIEVRKKAMDLLARREHSAQELRRKLQTREFAADSIDRVLQQLQQDRLQSDVRFTESYVNHRVNAGIGPMKIRFELQQKGIGDALADEFLEPLAERWDSMMAEQRERKYGQAIPDDFRERMKQARFLQNRGFSPESVMRLFR